MTKIKYRSILVYSGFILNLGIYTLCSNSFNIFLLCCTHYKIEINIDSIAFCCMSFKSELILLFYVKHKHGYKN